MWASTLRADVARCELASHSHRGDYAGDIVY